MPHILAYDLGGSSLRLAIVDQDGTFVDQVRKPLAFTVEGDRHEADPDTHWWESFVAASAELEARGNDFGAITAVAGCGFTRTQVLLDAGRRSIRPAIGFPESTRIWPWPPT
jgi:xylulokinase